jgi:hypothetical protein
MQKFSRKNLNSDDHFDRSFSFIAMEDNLRNQSSNKRKKNNESTHTHENQKARNYSILPFTVKKQIRIDSREGVSR